MCLDKQSDLLYVHGMRLTVSATAEGSLLESNLKPHVARDFVTALEEAATEAWQGMLERYSGEQIVELQGFELRRAIHKNCAAVAAKHGWIVEHWNYRGDRVDSGQRTRVFPIYRNGRIGLILHNGTHNPLPASNFIRNGLTQADQLGGFLFEGFEPPRGWAWPDGLDELFVLRYKMDTTDETRVRVERIDIVVMDWLGSQVRVVACGNVRKYAETENVVDPDATPAMRSDAPVDEKDHELENDVGQHLRLRTDDQELN